MAKKAVRVGEEWERREACPPFGIVAAEMVGTTLRAFAHPTRPQSTALVSPTLMSLAMKTHDAVGKHATVGNSEHQLAAPDHTHGDLVAHASRLRCDQSRSFDLADANGAALAR